MFMDTWWLVKDIWRMWKSWVDDYLIYQTSMRNPGSSLGESAKSGRNVSFSPKTWCITALWGVCKPTFVSIVSVATAFIASGTPGPCTWEPRPSSSTATVCRLCSWRAQPWETWAGFKRPSSISERPCAWRPVGSTATKVRLAFGI